MTFEEIDLLVRRANPVPDPSELGSRPSADEDDDRRGTVMQVQDLSSTRAVDSSGEVNSTTEIQHGSGPRFPGGWVAVAAALVVVVALVGVSISTGDDDGNEGNDAAAVPTVSPAALADAFVARLADHDAPGAMSYLTANALVEAGGPVGLASEMRWRAASGFQLFFDRCREVGGSDESTVVRCPYAYDGIGSGEQGFEPYEGSSYRISVRRGWIDGFDDQVEFNENGFDADVWEPFYRWLLANHPDDVARMYVDGPDEATTPSTTDEAIALWERRSREYVEGPDPTDPP
jgi:hypothetical protein